ncbi:MAG TPA: S26 family signal peptidase [Candidatus Saccharimonadales bacterium]|nr:S26 family signal peptidase [Candidatus Saccharimonadales bacterium]
MFLLRRVNGASMHPNLPHGKLILASKIRKPRVGDVVVVKHHSVEVLKRVHDLKNGLVYLLGDNPDESTDSRHYGWLPVERIKAVVLGANNGQIDTSAEAE